MTERPRTYLKSEIGQIQADVRYSLFARSRNDGAKSMHCWRWHLQFENGLTLDKHYPDAHCVLKDIKSWDALRQFTVVAPGGIRLTPSAFLTLCTLPYYSHHHEGTTNA